MNKWQSEVQKSLLASEEAAIKELEKQYKKALKDINEKVKLFESDIKQLQEAINADGLDESAKAVLISQQRSKVYQKQYQQALQGQISGILDNLHGAEYASIEQYLKECYTDGYVGTMYDIAHQGIPVIIPIDQAAVVNAVLTDSKVSKGLYNALGVNVKKLKKTITQEVSRGIATGLSYNDIARNISNAAKAPLSRAKTIARTEGHRIQVTSTADAQKVAKAKGADVVKQWDSTLDGKTRDSHRQVDGEIRELDEKFSNGLKQPGDSAGGAGEVVNCRCALLTRARWALDEDELKTLEDRAKYFGLDKTKNFDDFKEKYLKATDEISKGEARKKLLDAIDNVKKQEEIDKQKSEDIINSIAKKLGVDNEKVNIKELPIAAQEITLKAVRQTINHFPQLRKHIKSISYDSTLKATAKSETLIGDVYLGSLFKDFQKLEKWYNQQVTLSFFAKGTSAYSIVTHELGHQLDGLFTLNGLMGGTIDQFGQIRTSQAVKNEVLERLGFYERMKELRLEYKAKGFVGEKLNHAMDFERREFITAHVSEYAAVNEREFFAECFSEYMTSDEPREAAKIFGEIIEKLYGELK